MKGLLELLSSFHWLSLPETVIDTLWYADWKGAYETGGAAGLLSEALNSLVGYNTWTFFVPVSSASTGGDIKRLLAQHGVEMWGYGFAHGELFFRVRKNKAAWAQYVLLKHGVPLQHRLIGSEPRAQSNTGGRPIRVRSKADSTKAAAAEIEQRADEMIDALASYLDL